MVGGGPHMEKSIPASYPTVIHGRVVDGRLRVTVHNVRNGEVVFDKAI